MRKKVNKTLLMVVEVLVYLFVFISASKILIINNISQPIFILLIVIFLILVLITAINIFVIVYKTINKYLKND